MKGIVLLFGSVLLLSSIAEESATTTLSSVERNAQAVEKLKKHTGGFVRKPGTGRGLILVVDAQSRVGQESLLIPPAFVEKRLHLPAAYRKASLSGLPSAEKVKAAGASVAVFVVDRSDLEETLIVAPESRWAMVNVFALAKDNCSSDILNRRTTTEVGRAIGFVAGSCNSQYTGTTMGPIKDVASLDVFKGNGELPLDHFRRVVDYMAALGVTQIVEKTYRKACQEGWAPDPDDENQKAIWDEYHTLPTKPLEIKFKPDSKKSK